MTMIDHDTAVALRLLPEGQQPITEADAYAYYNEMTDKEKVRVSVRFGWMCGAFQRPIQAWIQCVQDEVNAIAENLPPDM